MNAAADIIRDEHLAIASVLYGLRYVVRQSRDRGAAPDFRLLHAMLDYITEFPERLHHPKEDECLFKALAGRCAQARPLIAELTAEHARGGRLIDELKVSLLHHSRDGSRAFGAFAKAVDEYADFHWQHMSKEEEVLLPLAQRHLLAEDWERIGDAFRENDNPLFGIKPKEEAERLFRKILSLAPAPIGATTGRG